SEYAIRVDGARFRASNRAQALLSHFDARGAELRAREGRGQAIRIGGLALARGEASANLTAGEPGPRGGRAGGAAGGKGECLRRLESVRGGVTEFWENRSEGVEHGFVVRSAPQGEGSLELLVGIEGAQITVAPDGDEARILQAGGALALRYAGLTARDAR